MEKVLYGIALVVLMWSTFLDIKYRVVNKYVLIIASAVALMLQVIWQNIEVALWGALLGMIVIIAAKITKQAIGFGDGFVLLFLGLCLGWQKVLSVLVMTLLMISLCGIVMLCFGKVSKKTSWPMVPWMLTALVIGVVTW